MAERIPEKTTKVLMEGPPRLVDIHRFPWKRLAIALVKASGLHTGIWRVRVSFGTSVDLVLNLGSETYPAHMTPIEELQLVPDEKVGPLSVDAAVVNPDRQIEIVTRMPGTQRTS